VGISKLWRSLLCPQRKIKDRTVVPGGDENSAKEANYETDQV